MTFKLFWPWPPTVRKAFHMLTRAQQRSFTKQYLALWHVVCSFFKYLFILAALSLSCSTWNFRSLLRPVGSFTAASRIFNSAIRTLSCGTWDLAIKPRSPALGVQSLSHWTTREVPSCFQIRSILFPFWKLLWLHRTWFHNWNRWYEKLRLKTV